MKPSFPMQNRLFLMSITVMVFCASVSSALAQWVQHDVGEDPVTTFTFSISAKSPEPPIMKYRLYPSFSEQFKGNAAPLYHRAILLTSQHLANVKDQVKYWEQIDRWRNMPLDELPIDEVEQVVNSHASALQEVSFAARRSFCDWSLPTHENGVDIFSVLLPEIQEMRTMARLLTLRIRLRLAQGRFDDAITDLQTGFAMARHVGNHDFIVNSLVGIAIGTMMDEQLLSAISVDSAPNLYWSIVNQPSPLIEIRNAIDVEQDSILAVFPELKEAKKDKDVGDRAYWDRKLSDVITRFMRLEEGRQSDWEMLAYRTIVFSQVPRVKQELVKEMGYDKAEVDTMPGSRAILLYSVNNYERLRDEFFAPLGLPYYQAKKFYPPGDQFSNELIKGDPLLLARLLLPATQQFQKASVRLQRWHTMLQAVESIRDYAATHGKLPESLDQVDYLPIPNNPFNNHPLIYKWHADKPLEAILEGDAGNRTSRFQITLRQP